MLYTVNHSDKGLIEYRESKRWLWSLVILFILMPLPVIAIYLEYETPWVLIAPLFVTYLLLPVLDLLVGTDKNNPPEELVAKLEADPHYNTLLRLCIPAHVIALVASAWLVGTQDIGIVFVLAFAAVMGMYSGLSINTAHEIGHKNTKAERFLSRVALAVTGYGHFCIEHNVGHHRDVATPLDPASSRMGESIYRFILREIPGAAKRGWLEESKRLKKRNQKVWSLDNHILQSYLMTLVLQGGLIILFGWILIPFFLVHNFFGWFQLTSANYIEHYGLLREKKSNGRYERCQPHHSWNANHYVSNLLLFQLQRHSDHHANPSRSYQSLRSLESLPELPTSYFGMYVLAYIPPLWFRVMNQRVLNVPHINGDLDKVNIDPKHEAKIRKQYG